MRYRYCMIFLLLFIAACSSSSPPQPTKNDVGVLYVTPVDLFAGDAEKFKPFLGTEAGAVKLEYEGSKTKMKVETEIWENGKKVQTVQSMASNIVDLNNEGKGKFNGEFIISAQQGQGTDGNFQFDLNLVLFQ